MPTTPTPCPGPCNRKHRRTLADGHTPDWPPVDGEPVWCIHCTALVDNALHHTPAGRDDDRRLPDLPQLLVAIHLEAIHGTPTPGAKVRVSRESPAWPGQAARMLTDLIVSGLLDLEDDLRRLRALSPRPALPEGTAAGAAVTAIRANLDWLLNQHPDAADPDLAPGAQLLRWQWIATRFIHADEPRTVQTWLPCPRCDLLTLCRVPGEEGVVCGNCYARYGEDEYQRRFRQYAIWERARTAAAVPVA